MALNLDNSRNDPEVSQAWVIGSMSALGRFSTDTEAPAFGNGCSRQERLSNISHPSGTPLAPSPNVNRGGRFGKASTNNDDSCDLALLPAATLLLPHFEVDPDPRRTVTTLLSITNVSPEERIARVTLWTDYAVPVLTFNVFLTGYDVQSIDLYDVLVRGIIAPENGTGSAVSSRGKWSGGNGGLSLGACARLAGPLPPQWPALLLAAFQEGRSPECDEVGREHFNAAGYATIDVVRNSSTTQPTEESYWSRDVAFDNVLIGDYQNIDNVIGAADGAPMVHIRVIPEGGGRAAFARTFYSRYARGGRDARQPLPSAFAASWSLEPESAESGTSTWFDIWREGVTHGVMSCGRHAANEARYEVVRFDDRENAVVDIRRGEPPFPGDEPRLPATSRSNVQDGSVYPLFPGGATSGWFYFNLDDVEGVDDELASQAWVVAVQRTAAGRATRRDAAALGNGCSAPVAKSEIGGGTAIIGPAPNVNP